jgi:hypothetical protein
MTQSLLAKKPEPPKSSKLRVLPIELGLSDRLIDERGGWHVIGRPYAIRRRRGGSRARHEQGRVKVRPEP